MNILASVKFTNNDIESVIQYREFFEDELLEIRDDVDQLLFAMVNSNGVLILDTEAIELLNQALKWNPE